MRSALLTLLTAGALGLGGAAVAAAQPRLRAEEATWDAGRVPGGRPVEHDFYLHNEGTEPLEIVEVQPTCGCTVAGHDDTIAPGGRGVVHVVVDVTDLRGPVAKGVRVLTNDPDTPELTLVVKADVRHRLGVAPSYARFISVVGESSEPAVATLWATDFEDLRIVGVDSPYPFLHVGYREATSGERRPEGVGRQWRLSLDLDRKAPVGPLGDFVVVRVNHPRQKELRIPVAGYVRPVLVVSPPEADFGPKELAHDANARLEVRNLSARAVSLGEVTLELEGARATLNELEPGRRWELQVTLTPDMAKGPFEATLRVATDAPRQPVLQVPVRGEVR